MMVRKALPEDIEQIAVLGRKLWDIHVDFDPDYYGLEENFHDLFKDWVKDQLYSSYQFLFVAADNDGTITGFISGFVKPLFPWFKTKTVGHLSYLIVDEKYRRKGVGKMLENEAAKWFREKNIRYVELYVEEKNSTGKSAWNYYGFLPFKLFLRKPI